jgi:hypothetical protein
LGLADDGRDLIFFYFVFFRVALLGLVGEKGSWIIAWPVDDGGYR